ncbi:MAG: DUF523 domain-containing protein [Erysipelotrichaceae bacterium]|nr:DUF523 domain-containing protein [Erysipelotrichaceae bacterium]
MEKLMISACLMGINCRYDGGNTKLAQLDELKQCYELIPVCPETLAGLPCPRFPIEIVGDRVLNNQQEDVTEVFHRGADCAMELWKASGCPKVLLQSRSPSCGKGIIYDGTFTGKKISGNGIFAQKLIDAQAEIYSELEIEKIKA